MNDATKPDADRTKKTAYLKEAMRLTELGMEEHYIRNTVLERKATLLVTFCVAIIGYLITAESKGVQICVVQIFHLSETVATIILLILKVISVVFLGVAVVYGISIFKVGFFLTKGIDAKDMLYDNCSYDYDEFVEHYLEDTKEKSQKTEDNLKKKTGRLKIAYTRLFIGLISFALFVLIKEIACILF